MLEVATWEDLSTKMSQKHGVSILRRKDKNVQGRYGCVDEDQRVRIKQTKLFGFRRERLEKVEKKKVQINERLW